MELITNRLRIREFKESDYDFYVDIETNSLCLQYESDTVPTNEVLYKKFKETLDDINKEPRIKYRLIVSLLNTDETIGIIIIWLIDKDIREWEIGYEFHPDYWGNGYAPEAIKALIKFSLSNLNAHRIQAICNDENVNSEKVMIKSGMKKEGTFRSVRFLNNRWVGSHIYSIIETDLL